MLQLKTKPTTKKFYDKWLYKVSLKLSSAGIFRYTSYDKILEICQNDQHSNTYQYSIIRKAQSEKETVIKLVSFLSSIEDTTPWSKRIETNQFDFYTNDKKLYDSFSLDFSDILIHRFEPNIENLDAFDGPQTIVAKKLPHNRYNYKVYLLPHKMKGRKEDKIKFVDWVKTQVPRITCTEAVEKWFITTDWNWDRRYVLVEDENTLLMLKLRNSDVVGRIYKYSICDK